MNRDEDDITLARVWRGVSGEVPGLLLDTHILAAARARARRRFLVPAGALLAASLVLAFYMGRQQPAPPPVLLDTSSFGLYEGRETVIMDTQTIRRMPGGSSVSNVVYP